MRQNKYRIYLAGACKNVSPEESNRWRQECQNWAAWHDDVYVFNPNSFYNYWDKKPVSSRSCMQLFLQQLKSSQLVLVNLTDSDESVGTGIEIAKAHSLGIPIIGFYDPEAGGVYSWSAEMCDRVYRLGNNDVLLDDILDEIYRMYVEG